MPPARKAKIRRAQRDTRTQMNIDLDNYTRSRIDTAIDDSIDRYKTAEIPFERAMCGVLSALINELGMLCAYLDADEAMLIDQIRNCLAHHHRERAKDDSE